MLASISPIACAAGLLQLTLFWSSAIPADASVYRCTIDGVVTFSDRPCGDDAQPYRPSDTRVSVVAAPPPAKATSLARRSVPPRDTRGESIAAQQIKQAERCTRIDRTLRQIRSQLRAGYDAAQGERLKERQRRLSQQRREERC